MTRWHRFRYPKFYVPIWQFHEVFVVVVNIVNSDHGLMVQQIKVLSAKLDNPSLIPMTLVGKEHH